VGGGTGGGAVGGDGASGGGAIGGGSIGGGEGCIATHTHASYPPGGAGGLDGDGGGTPGGGVVGGVVGGGGGGGDAGGGGDGGGDEGGRDGGGGDGDGGRDGDGANDVPANDTISSNTRSSTIGSDDAMRSGTNGVDSQSFSSSSLALVNMRGWRVSMSISGRRPIRSNSEPTFRFRNACAAENLTGRNGKISTPL